MNNRIALVAVAAAAAVLMSGCATVVAGTAAPAGAGSGAGQAPVIPEEPADWTIAAVDPCTLLQGVPVAAKAPPFLSKPHNCAIDYTTPAGRPDRVVVRVGTVFDTHGRAHNLPITLAGRIAYQARDPENRTYDPATCEIDIPLSATRSIQVVTDAAPGDAAAGCAPTRAFAEPVAAKLADPAAIARTAPASGLVAWQACDLLEKSLDNVVADRRSLGTEGPDSCKATVRGERDKAPEIDIDATGGPAQLDPPGRGDTLVQLPNGPALQQPYGSSMCKVVTVMPGTPGAPKQSAGHVLTITSHNSPDLCGAAVAAANKLVTTLQGPPPPAGPAPATLGFTPGQTDDVMPAPCGLYGNTTPDTCRAVQHVDVPKGAQAVLQAGTGPTGADVACAVVQQAAAPVIGEISAAAEGKTGCTAMSNTFSIEFAFYDHYSGRDDCAPVTVAGQQAVSCDANGATYQLLLPMGGGKAGAVFIQGELITPRGDISLDMPRDAEKVRDLTTKVATAVVQQFLT